MARSLSPPTVDAAVGFPMNNFLKRALIVAALCVPVCALADAGRPFTVDDALHMEQLGPGAFTPDGSGFVFVQMPPFDQFPDFSLVGLHMPLGTLMWMPMASGAKAEPVLPPDPAALRAL